MRCSKFLFSKEGKGIFNIKPGKDGKLSQAQYVMKHELDKPYFADMNSLREDPSGKIFPATAYIDGWKPFPLLNETFQEGKKIEKENWNNNTKIFIVFQLPYYAMTYMKEWKDAIVERFPQIEIYAIEMKISKLGYRILGYFTENTVKNAWISDVSKEKKEEIQKRIDHYYVWNQKNTYEGIIMRDNLHINNRFIPFIFGVDKKGNVNFRAVGKMQENELDVLQKVISLSNNSNSKTKQ